MAWHWLLTPVKTNEYPPGKMMLGRETLLFAMVPFQGRRVYFSKYLSEKFPEVWEFKSWIQHALHWKGTRFGCKKVVPSDVWANLVVESTKMS